MFLRKNQIRRFWFQREIFLQFLFIRIHFVQNILSKNTTIKNKAFKLNSDDGVFSRNLDSILKLSEIYNNDLVLIHLPQKQEVFENSFNKKSKGILNFFLEKKFNYINGLEKCNFEKNDFYKYDGHLNSEGYQKLFDCTLNLLEKNSL